MLPGQGWHRSLLSEAWAGLLAGEATIGVQSDSTVLTGDYLTAEARPRRLGSVVGQSTMAEQDVLEPPDE